MVANQFNGEIVHFTGIRFRVNGQGNLQIFLQSLDNVNNVQATDLAMASSTNREPTKLINYIDQRGYLHLKTTEINEYFIISKITIFVKPLFTSYPG